jgi:hypothetical protein
MMKPVYKLAISFVLVGLMTTPAWCKHEADHPLSEQDWATVEKNIGLLDGMNFMPALMPIIMRNQDALQLRPEQIASFQDWRKLNYVNMVNVMNEIIEKRIAFKKAALDAIIPDTQLIEMQNEILLLQQKLLTIKLSCRKLLVETFTDEQWENFGFVVSDNPKLSVFFQ